MVRGMCVWGRHCHLATVRNMLTNDSTLAFFQNASTVNVMGEKKEM